MKNKYNFNLSDIDFNRFINIILRSITLASKFLLVIFFAKFLEPHDLGVYGLFVATVGYGIYLIGFEFYTYSMRDLISAEQEHKSLIIKNQFVFYAFSYLLFTPLFLAMFVYEIIPWKYFLWLAIILPLEHFSQELNRILIALSDQLYASVILFIRSGLWCLLVIATQYHDSSFKNLNFIFAMWASACFIACLLALKRISAHCRIFSHYRINIQWITTGIKVALPMLIASLAIRGLYTFDKYIIENLNGLEILGVYIFFIGISTAVLSFIDAGIIDFTYPRLIQAAASKKKFLFENEMKSLKNNIIYIGSSLIVACGIAGYLLTNYIDKPAYTNNLYVLYWLLVATTINIASLIPHLGLYALGQNKHIILSQISGLIVFLLTVYFLKDIFYFDSILIAMCMAWLSIFLWKLYAYKKCILNGK